jgi:hypothetical protein
MVSCLPANAWLDWQALAQQFSMANLEAGDVLAMADELKSLCR